jgi:hypothetical protein
MHYVFSTRGNYRVYEFNCYTIDTKKRLEDNIYGFVSKRPSARSYTRKVSMTFTNADKRAFMQFLRDLREDK